MIQPLARHLEVPIDTLRRVATPEGCELSLRIAGPTVRARAWLFDFLIRLVLFLVAVMILAKLEQLGAGVALLVAFVLEWLYPILFEVYWRGATPGKRLSNLVVLHDDGTPVGWGASFARNTLRFIDFLPFGYACGLLTLWLNADSKRLGDLLAGTVVVYRAENPPVPIKDDFFESEASPFPLTLAEQRALLEYRQRAATLTEARAAELAELARPLTDGMPSDEGKKRLFRIANGLLGRRPEPLIKTPAEEAPVAGATSQLNTS